MDHVVLYEDDPLLDLDKGRLSLLDDDADFIVCRRCRASYCSHGQQQVRPDSVVGAGVIHGIIPSDDSGVSFPQNATYIREEEMDDVTQESFGDGTTHCHPRSKPGETSRKVATRKLIAVCVLCVLFMCAEAMGGYLANSLALMSDAAHLLTDLLGLIVNLLAIYLGTKRPTQAMSFGYARSEILGALFSILFIWIVTGVLVYLAVLRVIHKEDVEANTMLVVSCIGIVFNIIMAFILHPICCKSFASHSHGFHGHSHGSKDNINIRSALIHVFGDLLQSVGVAIAALIIKFRPDLSLADPVCTFIFSAIIICTTMFILRDITYVLMEGVPRTIDTAYLLSDLRLIRNVSSVHDLHIWSLTMDQHALNVHLVTETPADGDKVLKQAIKIVQNKYGIQRCAIQIEKYSTDMDSCQQCSFLQPQ